MSGFVVYRTGSALLLIALALTISQASPATAQEGQLGADAPLQAPDDALGVPPQAKITASWPRTQKILTVPKRAPAVVPARRAKAAQISGPSSTVSDGIDVEMVRPKGDPFAFLYKSTPQPRPGQVVTLTAEGSSDVDAPPPPPGAARAGFAVREGLADITWRVEWLAGGVVHSQVFKDATIQIQTAADTPRITATLTVTDVDGLQSTAALVVPVVPNRPPVLNVKRIREILQCKMRPAIGIVGGTPEIKTTLPAPGPPSMRKVIEGLPAVVANPVTIYSNGCDPDGEIIGYEINKATINPLPSTPTQPGDLIPHDGAATYHDGNWRTTTLDSFVERPTTNDLSRQRVEYKVVAYDDEGAASEATFSLPVVKACAVGPVDVGPYLTVTPGSACVQRTAEGVTIAEPGSFWLNGLEITSPNAGSTIEYGADGGAALIVLKPGTVTAVNSAGVRLDLPGLGSTWEVNSKGELTKFRADDGTLGGLKITGSESPRIATKQGNKWVKRFQARLNASAPADFSPPGASGPTSAQSVTFTATDATQASMAQAGPFTMSLNELEVGGVGIRKATLRYSGDDDWDIAGTFLLNEPIPLGVEIDAKAGIRDGAFGYLDAATTFPGNGIPVPGTGVNLDYLRFALDLGAGIETPCVPRIGKKKVSFLPVRQMFAAYHGISNPNEPKLYNLMPDLQLDYGVPKFQACGTVGFHTLAKPLGKTLAEGRLSVGVADYASHSVFRIVGKPLKLIGVPSELLFELYSDTYIHFEAKAQMTFEDALRIRAGLDFAARLPKFNASAYAEVCILVLDLGCANAQALLSSKGVGACLTVDVAFFEFSPGATYVFGGKFTPYLDGCDIGDVKVAIKSTGGPTVVKLPPPGSPGANAAQRRGDPYAPGQTATLPVDQGATGAVFSVTGTGGLPRFVLEGPDGAGKIGVDEVPSPQRILRAINKAKNPGDVSYRVVKSPSTGVTSVIIPRARPGAWKVTLLPDSVPASEIRVAQGAPKTKVASRLVRRDGGRRGLSLNLLDRRDGVVARVLERGATGQQQLAEIPLDAGKTIKRSISFVPRATRPEPRVVDVYFERYGMPVGHRRIGQYAAPAPPAPPAPRGVTVRRAGQSVAVRWTPMKGVRNYEVAVTTNDGRRTFVQSRTNRIVARLPLESHDAVNVKVRAVSTLGRRGATSTDRIAARRAKPQVVFTPRARRTLARLRR
jgi:hypothetical protein